MLPSNFWFVKLRQRFHFFSGNDPELKCRNLTFGEYVH